MTKIFIPQTQQLDEKAASAKGELIPLMPSGNKSGLEPDRIKFLMVKALSSFNDGDYLLLDGRNTYCMVAASILSVLRNSIDILIWNSSSSDYVSRMLTFMDIPSPKPIVSDSRAFLVNDMHAGIEVPMQSIVLTKGSDPDFMSPENIKTKMANILKNSHEHDYILCSGSRLHNVVASSIMARMHRRVNYLLWNPKSSRYERRSAIYSNESIQEILSR